MFFTPIPYKDEALLQVKLVSRIKKINKHFAADGTYRRLEVEEMLNRIGLNPVREDNDFNNLKKIIVEAKENNFIQLMQIKFALVNKFSPDSAGLFNILMAVLTNIIQEGAFSQAAPKDNLLSMIELLLKIIFQMDLQLIKNESDLNSVASNLSQSNSSSSQQAVTNQASPDPQRNNGLRRTTSSANFWPDEHDEIDEGADGPAWYNHN